MLEGFYTAASGVLMEQRNFEVLANNMSNTNTPGFRASRLMSSSFKQTYMTILENGKYTYIGQSDPIRVVDDVTTEFNADLLQETGRPFDMALNGEGYFTIQGGDGETAYLTRNGAFDIDEEGYLILPDKGRVLGEKGPIQVGGSDFTVFLDGTVLDKNGKTLDRLLIQAPSAQEDGEGGAGQALTKYQNGLYRITDGEALEQVNTPVYQQVLERSNVDLNREYTQMMTAQRTFQSCSAALKAIDAINEKAASRIGSVN
ncbi:MAG: flagellar hook-basal body protein [Oscillospiraceae bacterium]|nr:flagellar hook-basal body protein [Oscillospiraceae bacterium]